MTRTAVLALLALALTVPAGCGGSDETQPTSGDPAIVSADSLRQAASEGTTPIYWAGEREGTELELSRPDKDRAYVRYLTGDAEAGDKRAGFLTVGTYAQPNAVAFLRRQAKRSGGTLDRAPDGATVYFDRASSRSVYLAYTDSPVEVEVYDPNFEHALRLVESGRIVAVG